MIRTEALIALFRQALEENWGYIWGTAGEKWTEARQKELEKTTDADRAQGRQYGNRWIGHTVADCSGLFSWAFRRLGGTMYHGSDTMYRKWCVNKGEMKKGKRSDGGTLKPGTAVFVWNGKTYSHVGLYVGNGTVIEAMSTMRGVTTTKVSASKWTHWGELAGVDYSIAVPAPVVIPTGAESVAEGEPPATASGGNLAGGEVTGNEQSPRWGAATIDGADTSNLTLRKGSKGAAVKEMQFLLDRLGYDLGSWGVDGDFGRATEAAVKRFQSDHRLIVDGICGPKTWAELVKVTAEK